MDDLSHVVTLTGATVGPELTQDLQPPPPPPPPPIPQARSSHLLTKHLGVRLVRGQACQSKQEEVINDHVRSEAGTGLLVVNI